MYGGRRRLFMISSTILVGVCMGQDTGPQTLCDLHTPPLSDPRPHTIFCLLNASYKHMITSFLLGKMIIIISEFEIV